MPAVVVSGDPIVVVVDAMELRRALVVHFLKDWALAEKIEMFSLAPNDPHRALREEIGCPATGEKDEETSQCGCSRDSHHGIAYRRAVLFADRHVFQRAARSQ